MKKTNIVITTLSVLLLASLAGNIVQHLEKSLPIISDGNTALDVTRWEADGNLSFEGAPVDLQNKSTNLKSGYQFFSVEVRVSPDRTVCQLTNTLLVNNIVSIERPFQAAARPCIVLEYSAASKSATVESNGIRFSVKDENVTWQDKSGNGPMISGFERAEHPGKYL